MTEIQLNKRRKLESKAEECSDALKLAAMKSAELDQNNGYNKPAHESEATEHDDKEAKILELAKEVEIELKQEFPTLVLEVFLEWLKDVELLKTCRLVNQYWNSLACASLRKHSVVNLREVNLCRFMNCKKSRAKIRNRIAIPRPFQNFHVWTSGFKNDDFFDLARRNKNKITSVTLRDEYPVENQRLENLSKFLREATKNVSTLYIEHFRNETLDKVLRDVKFPVLTNLTMALLCRKESACNHIEALIKYLEYSCLQRLTLKLQVSSHSLCVPSLLKINLSHVVELDLELVETGKNDHFWKLLPQLKLPSLNIFKFKNNQILNEEVQPLVTAFLSNVALSLDRLHIHYIRMQLQLSIRLKEVNYPNLKVLDVRCPADISGCFTAERFPSLQTLSFIVSKVEQLEFLSDGHDFLEGVWKLHIVIDTENPEGLDLLFPPWMANLTRKFPIVVDFALIDTKKELSFSFSLLDSLQVCANLRVLHVEANIDFMALYGTSLDDVPEYDELGQLQELPERSSLLNFKKLEELRLAGGNPEISNDTFVYCLTHLTTLKYLEFFWSPLLSPNTVATYTKYLRGLKTMKINFPNLTLSTTTTKREIEEAFEGRKDLRIDYSWGGRVNLY